jgi:glycosyltransferase involved in cell wall biosynthesis
MSKKASILVTSGLIDLQQAGNQVVKNTLIGYAARGYDIIVLTAIPSDYLHTRDYNQALGELADRIKFIRMPGFLNRLFYALRAVKNAFRKKGGGENLPSRYQSLAPRSYHEDLGVGAHIMYVLAWLGYLVIGAIQGSFIILRNRPKLLYGYEVYGAPVASILGAIFGIPVVTRFQGTVLPRRNWKTNLLRQPRATLGLRSPGDAVIMTNDGTHGKEVLESLGVPSSKIYFWRDGLEVEPSILQFDAEKLRRNLEIQRSTRVLLMVSKLKFFKRIDRAIHAVKVLREEFGSRNTLLLIVGDGPEKANLGRLAKELGVNDLVRFVGAVPHSDVGKYFKLADVFILVNDVGNLGNQLLEALYYGCCIITLDDKSTEGIIKHEWNGILVGMDNLEMGLPQAIDRVLKDEELRENLKRNAREFAQQNLLSWEERMKKEIEVVERLMKSAGK